MDRAPIPFPNASAERAFDPLERDLTEVDAAISMVVSGVAARVRLANLSRPEAAAAHAAAVSGGLAVRVRLEGTRGEARTVTIEAAASE
jgi:hypothetical protein